jgi:hypothetical protein
LVALRFAEKLALRQQTELIKHEVDRMLKPSDFLVRNTLLLDHHGVGHAVSPGLRSCWSIAYPPLLITDNAFFNGAGEICTAPSSGRFISRIK